MTKAQFNRTYEYMLQCMQKTVHDPGHVDRVLYTALRLAKTMPEANRDVVVLSALLHDVGRGVEERMHGRNHADIGAEMAFTFLTKEGWGEAMAALVRDCIATHSHSGRRPPQCPEAEILYDADKLDLTGAIGTARAILFGAQIDEPFYGMDEWGNPQLGRKKGENKSLMQEYHKKLRKMPTLFYTEKARKIARKRQRVMDGYFDAFEEELQAAYGKGRDLLEMVLEV